MHASFLTVLLVSGVAPSFEVAVASIFQAKCVKCHGEQVRKADLRLDQYGALMKGGESGRVVNTSQWEESTLWEMVHDRAMPPEGEPPLTAEEIQRIRDWLAGGAASNAADDPAGHSDEGLPSYLDVVPVMLRRCVMCHGGEYQRGDVDLRYFDTLIATVKPGDSTASALVKRVVEQLCPPKEALGEAGIEPMTPAEQKLVRRWIDDGAKETELTEDVAVASGDPLVSDEDRQHWSFQSPRHVRVPQVGTLASTTKMGGAMEPVDAFVQRQLAAHELNWSPTADRQVLVRRVAYALTGLPPERALVERYLDDQRPGAYERMIDQLLASPHYGEKWGRFWLDLAGYADSEGKRNADMIRPYAWRYRDWVVRAFNADMPYDQFLVEQLAGDELVDWGDGANVGQDVIDKLVATGFLRMAPDGTSADPVNRYPDRLEVISDTVDIVGRGLMGMTLNCARCHTHKYDPIPQRDYYRFVAIFKGALDEYDWLTPQPFGNQWKDAKRRHLTVNTPEVAQEVAEHNADLSNTLKQARRDLKAAQETKNKQAIKALTATIKSTEAKLKKTPAIRALWDRGRPSPTFVYRRGDEMQPAQLVGPGVPSVLTDGRTPFQPAEIHHSTPKTGRRLEFARWLTRPDHPLTARIIVNRIWRQHFGRGIVASIDNFGKLGVPPSHPELLDWLARDFVEHGWSIKRLHRQILCSKTWQQVSVANASAEKDPENQWLSRMLFRRLDAEEVRDSLLLFADRLNRNGWGQPDEVTVRSDGLVVSKPVNGYWRRSVYLRQRRKEMPTIFETFDLPQMNPNCSERKASTVVTQPLHLLNNAMVHDLAGHYAKRVLSNTADRQVDQRDAAVIHEAFKILFQRDPNQGEVRICRAALKQLTDRAKSDDATGDPREIAVVGLCHALMNSASFLYVD